MSTAKHVGEKSWQDVAHSVLSEYSQYTEGADYSDDELISMIKGFKVLHMTYVSDCNLVLEMRNDKPEL